jgi:hypothetical protein
VGKCGLGFAICTKSNVKYRFTTTPDGTGPGRTGTAECPAGWTLIGGGVFIATTNSWVNSSYPAKNNAWKVRVNDTVGGVGGMQAGAQCRRNSDVVKVAKVGNPMTAGNSATVTAVCAPGAHVIGGGGKISGGILEAHLAASFPIDGSDADSIPDDGWRVIGYNNIGVDKLVTSYALCVTRG